MALGRESLIHGSKLLKPVSSKFGLPLDHVNYITAQLIAIGLSIAFRKLFNRKIAPTWARHLIAIITGVWLTLFCFGPSQTLQLLLVPAVSYLLMTKLPDSIAHHAVLLWSLGYLSAHNIKMIVQRDPEDYVLDFSGPLMIFVQKLSALAYSVHDGRLAAADKNFKEKLVQNRSKFRSKYMVETEPSFLEFFSYIFNFFGVLSGPTCFYNDFIEYMETDLGETTMRTIVGKKLAVAFAFLFGGMFLESHFHFRSLANTEFLENSTWFVKILFINFGMIGMRAGFHFAWTLSDALHNSAGFGYNKESKKWDLVTNVNSVECELATNPQTQIRNWNIQTTYWLRLVVYERSPKKLATFLTFGLSAMWHGFFPGYYLFFSFAHFLTLAHRRLVKKGVTEVASGKFQNVFLKWVFYAFNLVAYHTVFNYGGIGMQLLTLERGLTFYKSVYFAGHFVVAGVLAFPLRRMVDKKDESKSK